MTGHEQPVGFDPNIAEQLHRGNVIARVENTIREGYDFIATQDVVDLMQQHEEDRTADQINFETLVAVASAFLATVPGKEAAELKIQLDSIPEKITEQHL